MLSMFTHQTPIAVLRPTIIARTSMKVRLASVPCAHSKQARSLVLMLTAYSDVRQCLIYDSPAPNARLIGVEYMISAALYETLEPSERRLWHSHVYEVKSGMLIMPGPSVLSNSAWEIAETKEMEDVISLYGKTYHFWQVDRGDKLPLGGPELMMSLTEGDRCPEGFDEAIADRDARYSVDSKQKAKKREYIKEPEIHQDADSMWKDASSKGGEKA